MKLRERCWIAQCASTDITMRRGLCPKHYKLWKQNYRGLCVLAIEGCEKPLGRRLGLCSGHYHAWRKYGDPHTKGEIGRRGPEHWRWASNGPPTHQGRHQRLRRARGKASDAGPCIDCGKEAYDWSQVHGTDGLDIYNDYVPRCRSCHLAYDDPITKRVTRKTKRGDHNDEH